MARTSGEAKLDKKEWSLVFCDVGMRKRLRMKRGFQGDETKNGLRMQVEEEVRQFRAQQDSEENVNLGSYLVSNVAPISTKKRNESSSVVTGKSVDTGGRRPAAAYPTFFELVDSGRKKESRNWEGELKQMTWGSDDVVLPGQFNCGGSSAGVCLTSCSALRADEKRQKVWPASELCLTGDRTPDQKLPVLSTSFRGRLSAACPKSDSALHRMDSDTPEICHEVDNFIIHKNSHLVCITELPVYIDGVFTGGVSGLETVYLVGTVGPDCRTFKQKVEVWSLMLDPSHRPRYLLRTMEGDWVKLLNPRIEYSKLYQQVLALGHFLNFVKKLPNASPEAAERDLRRMCSTHKQKPSIEKLRHHVEVITSFVKEDKDFARAPVLRSVFPQLFPERSAAQMHHQDETRKARKRYKVIAKKDKEKPCNGEQLKLQWDSVTRLNSEDDHRSRDRQRKIFTKAELNVEDPPICVLCDDGGDLLYCDGPCHRHFHATKQSGSSSSCASLGLTEVEVKDMGKYFCQNCLHDQQQCFICGQLGSSVHPLKNPEVRCCDIKFCNRFFHVDCAAAMLSEPRRNWQILAKAINDGREELYCPRHCCSVCGKAEMDEPGMLVQCRRCPKAWHRACLKDFSQSRELETTPIWLHYDREFIYCREHKIIPTLQTPARDHVRFPVVRRSAKGRKLH